MKKITIFLIVCCFSFSLFANSQAELVDSEPSTLDERFSYAYGYLMTGSILQNFPDIDMDYLLSGANAYLENNSKYSLNELYGWLTDYQEKILQEQSKANEELAKKNLADAEEFLQTNKKNKNVQVTDSGLQYEILKKGNGNYPTLDDTVECNYTLMLADGKVVETTSTQGEPAVFVLSNLIEGFSEGMTLISEGGKARLWIHPDLGYKDVANGDIEPNSLLIFDIELLSIK